VWTLLCGLPGLDLFSDVVINITVHVDGLGLSPGAGFRRVFAIDRPLLCWFFFSFGKFCLVAFIMKTVAFTEIH